jgi:hypothetical protein
LEDAASLPVLDVCFVVEVVVAVSISLVAAALTFFAVSFTFLAATLALAFFAVSFSFVAAAGSFSTGTFFFLLLARMLLKALEGAIAMI